MQPSETIDPSHHYASVVSHCLNTRNLRLGRLLHSHFIKTALTLNVFLANRLVDIYSKCNSIDCARRVFDDIPFKNTHSWNTIVAAYSQLGWFDDALNLFEEIPKRNLVSYNVLISGLMRHGLYNDSVDVFRRMQKGCSFVSMDEFTFVSVVGTCACLRALELLHQVHGVALVIGIKFNVVMYNALVDAYGKCGKPDCSYSIFSRMPEKDVVSWTSMVVTYARASKLIEACSVFNQMPAKNNVSWSALIAGFVQNGQGNQVWELFVRMREERMLPSAFTYASLLTACADQALLERGKQLHGHIIRCQCVSENNNVFLSNALIDMYSKCGNTKMAAMLFERFPEKDTVTWNSLITGLAQNGNGEKSLAWFERMIQENIQPNHVTFLGLLSACSHTGLVSEGIRIIETMEKDFGVVPRSDHYSVLIDLLARMNRLEEALDMIQKTPCGMDHIGMWGAVLGACQIHGNLDLATKAAQALIELEPKNTARYVMLANICAGAGRWEDARQVRRLIDEKQLKKEVAFSCIEIQNNRHVFIAKDESHCQSVEIYELLHKLLGHMKDTSMKSLRKFTLT